MKTPLLEVSGLTMRFGGLTAVDNLSFNAHEGEITSIIGPNGAGKTTVFNCITGFYRASSGHIRLNRNDGPPLALEKLTGHKISTHGKVGRTFQNIRLFSQMTVLENLLVAQHDRMTRSWMTVVGGLWNSAAYRQEDESSIALASKWLKRLELENKADELAGSLPYGDQRRLEIARAMCTEPRMLCLDEPAAGLNPAESDELNNFLDEIRRTQGVAILLIEHDMSVVMKISDYIIVLDYGCKISEGEPAVVKNDPAVIRAYLGDELEEETAVDRRQMEMQS